MICLSQSQIEVLVQSICGGPSSSFASSGLTRSSAANDVGGPKRVKRLQFPQFVAVIDRIATTMAQSRGTAATRRGGPDLAANEQLQGFPLSSWPLHSFLVEHFQPLAAAGGSILDSYRRQHLAEADSLMEDDALQQALEWNRPQLRSIFRVYTGGMHVIGGGGHTGATSAGGGHSSALPDGGAGLRRYAGGTGPGSKLLSRAGLLAFARDFRVVPDLLDLNSDKFVLACAVWFHYPVGGGRHDDADRARLGLSLDTFIDFIGHIALRASPRTLVAGSGGGSGGDGDGDAGLRADGPGSTSEMDPGSRGRALFAWLDQGGGQGRMRVREISGGTVSVDAFQVSA